MDQVSDQPLLSGIGQDEPPSESYFEFNIGYHGKTAGGKLVSDGEESRADGVPYLSGLTCTKVHPCRRKVSLGFRSM